MPPTLVFDQIILMRLRILLAILTMILGFQQALLATSCSAVPPCALVRSSSILFVGTVTDPGTPETNETDAPRDVTFRIDEIFAGLSQKTKEVVVTAGGTWLERGHAYLIDAYRRDGSRLGLMTCGSSEEVNSKFTVDVLKFLRLRAQGKTPTSLGVMVVDQHQPVPDVAVTILSQQEHFTARTNADGTSIFAGIQPGSYSLSAAIAHYEPDPDSVFDKTVDVVAGTCSGATISVKSEASVSGEVVDSKGLPVASLDLQLVSEPGGPNEKVSLNKPFFDATSDGEGRFLFESVSPGRYLLGSNIIGLNDTAIPPTFYPGQRTRSGAYPIEVKLGESVSNLRFMLPDFGARREITVCVLDENGKPVAAASVVSVFNAQGDDLARLGAKLSTNETGCVSASGYTGARYAIQAFFRPEGAAILQFRSSETYAIDPGNEPVHAVLVLHSLGRSPSRGH